ncbi:hypothetical protein D917_08750 [Trichinella nativa]|uniref:Uncharacterized protein n=1 Tax=Trichinella nativa TaxID=6335 RepID=A0A1Y3EN07_9BILA|nr:hypothetical protein D917_08750 [Trichinella nativa]
MGKNYCCRAMCITVIFKLVHLLEANEKFYSDLCNVENIPIQTVLLFNVLRSLDHYHPQQQRKQKLPLHKGCKNLFMPTTPFADAKIVSTTELNFESTIEALHANSSNNW